MSKIDDYRRILRQLEDWDGYLLEESRLPGPRANLELAFAAAAEGSEARFLKYADLDPSQASTNSPLGFLAICGVLGLGYQLEPGRNDIINRLRESASDSR